MNRAWELVRKADRKHRTHFLLSNALRTARREAKDAVRDAQTTIIPISSLSPALLS